MIESKHGHCGDCIDNETCVILLMRVLDDVQITGCKKIRRAEVEKP